MLSLQRQVLQVAAVLAASAGLSLAIGGCSRFHRSPPAEYVYVTAKQTYLRDRVAAVSNRTATVNNGDKLKILNQSRRFYLVETGTGEKGWIDDKIVATQQVFNQFDALAQQHKDDPTVATAVVRDDVYLHLAPGRETERFYRLAEGDKLKLLKRATLPKPLPPGMRAAPAILVDAFGHKDKTGAVQEPPPPTMEDWWLVRDAKGDTGWMLGRIMDVDAPDSIVRYSEGQRIVGAYVLTKVNDPDAPQDDKNIPVYVTAVGPYKSGLTYDFDQIRIFTWNIKKHRYETAFRDKNIEGYLPVEIRMATDPYGKAAIDTAPAPTFSYRVLSGDAPVVIPDPVTGAIVPEKTILKTYRLEGNIVRRVLQPGAPVPSEAHPEVVPQKKLAKPGRKR